MRHFVTLGLLLGAITGAFAADECRHRGDLDAPYCDADRDLVADPPADRRRWRAPHTIAFTYTPIEEPTLYERLLRPLTAHLSQCVGRRVVYFPVQSNAAQIEAMRSGRVQVAWFSTGPTAFAVNIAGAVPFAVKGDAQGAQGYKLMLIVRKDSAFQKPGDLKGQRVAHTSPTSNSGNLAPRALFPAQGLVPGDDYRIVYSGKHDHSILGVVRGEYDAAAVASDVLQRMQRRGQLRGTELRVLYESAPFPTEAVAYAHDLEPALRDKLLKCFYDYRFADDMRREFQQADRFVPVRYQRDWAIVRQVAEGVGERFDRKAYDSAARPAK
ncbi:phosphate/phosphite/phosphonate ABC transporter substrate-binding protein [Pseudaquabacterium terrae]|uniref:phosphate/phosphite/phosphonate ABC transporter substrate-binding protein n=1 Tax=Pseudaquabacterium terrae TaxID=2732868 RepID=UPI003CCD0750